MVDPQPLPPPAEEQGLHVCEACRSPLVQPVEWAAVDEGSWAVTLRCPECERWSSGVWSDAAVLRYDVELDEGTERLVELLQEMEAARLEEAAAAFSWALAEDLVLPEDF